MRLMGKRGFTLLWIVSVLILVLVLTMLTGCSGDGDPEENGDIEEGKRLSEPVRIAALKGPTGMGLASLFGREDVYQISLFQSPDEAVAKLLSGEADLAALSSNLAPVLYNRTDGDIRVLAVATGGVLHLLENEGDGGGNLTTLDQLAGKTILGSGKGGAPEYILRRLLLDAGLDPDRDLTINWLGNHSDVAAAFLSEPGAVALLPEPFVSTVVSKSESVFPIADLNDLWKVAYGSDLPMGIYVTTKGFSEEWTADLEMFMEDCYASAHFVTSDPKEASKIIAEQGILESAELAEQSIPGSNILFLTGAEMKTALDGFYRILFDMDPASLGGELPGDDIYFGM